MIQNFTLMLASINLKSYETEAINLTCNTSSSSDGLQVDLRELGK
jgi:hypothetical protein